MLIPTQPNPTKPNPSHTQTNGRQKAVELNAKRDDLGDASARTRCFEATSEGGIRGGIQVGSRGDQGSKSGIHPPEPISNVVIIAGSIASSFRLYNISKGGTGFSRALNGTRGGPSRSLEAPSDRLGVGLGRFGLCLVWAWVGLLAGRVGRPGATPQSSRVKNIR